MKYPSIEPTRLSGSEPITTETGKQASDLDQDTANPLDIGQWDFYLLPTTILNEKAGTQKRANLASLIKMGAEKCDFEHIHQRIVELACSDNVALHISIRFCMF